METALIVIALFLVEAGEPRAIVAVPQEPSAQAKAGAEELVRHIQLMSGATLPIKTEDTLTDADRAGGLVCIGNTQLAREAGIDVAALPLEGYVVRAKDKRLFLLGREDACPGSKEQRGTYFAVTSLLEEDLGVRWLWPGEMGTIVPKKDTIQVPELSRTHQPPLAQRRIRDGITNRKLRDALKDFPIDPKRYEEMKEESAQWMQRMRLGTRMQISAGHAFTRWYEEYHKDHLDYFALHLNGSREWGKGLGNPDRAKLCVSNPAVVDQWIANVKAALEKDPAQQCFSTSANDSYYTGHCTCEKCRAWDAPDAPDRFTYYDVTADGPTTDDYVSLSDRYLKFANRCAEALEKVASDKFVGTYAYGTWRPLPLREKVRDNIIIGFVGLGYFDEELRKKDLEYWNGWSKLAKRLYLRPNLLHGGGGMPAVYVHKLAQDFRHCYDTGMIATDFDSLLHHWATQGLNYYVLAKLLWDPHADVDKMVDDYCSAGFGPAAKEAKDYFVTLEKVTDKIASDTPAISAEIMEAQAVARPRVYDLAPRWYPLDVLQTLADKLDAAERAAQPDPKALERVRFLREGLRYAELRAPALRLWQKFQKLAPDDQEQRAKVQPEMEQAFDAVKAYYLKHADTWVISPQSVRHKVRPEIPRKK